MITKFTFFLFPIEKQYYSCIKNILKALKTHFLPQIP